MQTKDRRVELRTTADERALIERAAEASGKPLSRFILDAATVAAQHELADRTTFVLGADALDEWDRINERPARFLPGLRALFDRPSPFVDAGESAAVPGG